MEKKEETVSCTRYSTQLQAKEQETRIKKKQKLIFK
jgi:hypothetical protein